MTANAERPFLDAVLADPADDGVRLVYADWLEDHGQSERAEFVRLQIELARLPQYDARAAVLRWRERFLLVSEGGDAGMIQLNLLGQSPTET